MYDAKLLQTVQHLFPDPRVSLERARASPSFPQMHRCQARSVSHPVRSHPQSLQLNAMKKPTRVSDSGVPRVRTQSQINCVNVLEVK